jgi:hypothetical protein
MQMQGRLIFTSTLSIDMHTHTHTRTYARTPFTLIAHTLTLFHTP